VSRSQFQSTVRWPLVGVGVRHQPGLFTVVDDTTSAADAHRFASLEAETPARCPPGCREQPAAARQRMPRPPMTRTSTAAGRAVVWSQRYRPRLDGVRRRDHGYLTVDWNWLLDPPDVDQGWPARAGSWPNEIGHLFHAPMKGSCHPAAQNRSAGRCSPRRPRLRCSGLSQPQLHEDQPKSVQCLMRFAGTEGSFICQATRFHWGWVETDGDGTTGCASMTFIALTTDADAQDSLQTQFGPVSPWSASIGGCGGHPRVTTTLPGRLTLVWPRAPLTETRWLVWTH